MAPAMGATKKSQSWARAFPPAKTAGARLRAGLTDVPVIYFFVVFIYFFPKILNPTETRNIPLWESNVQLF